MPTARTVTIDALRALRAIAPGDDPTADELAAALSAVNALILELHEARGPLIDVDVTANYIAGEDQRVRVQAGAEDITVTLPNSVPIHGRWDPYDYGFSAPLPFLPAQGSMGAADGIQWRQPRDGARVEVVGTSQGLWFYRADTNAWQNAVALGEDDELPLNARYAGPFAALLAERLLDVMGAGQLSPGLTRRIASAKNIPLHPPRHGPRPGAGAVFLDGDAHEMVSRGVSGRPPGALPVRPGLRRRR